MTTSESLYQALLKDISGLRDDFRAMQLQASGWQATAYEDAFHMTAELIETALRRENNGEVES